MAARTATGPRSDGGYLVVTRDDGKVNEYRTATCGHCSYIIIYGRPPPANPLPGGWCGMCGKSICDTCCDDGKCTPFEKKLELEARSRALAKHLGI